MKIYPALLGYLFFSSAVLFAQQPGKASKSRAFFEPGAKLFSQKALANDYAFSASTGTYTELTGATSINNGQIWDDPEYIIPIGFTFNLYGISCDSLYFGMGLGGLITSKVDTNFDYGIMPFDTDLIDRGDLTGISKSPIRYKVEGAVGSRILKIEWKNAGFYDEGDVYGTLNDFINFQLWLYEGSNTIEMHYGAHQVTDPNVNYFGETGAVVGLADEALSNIYLLSGSPASPTVGNNLSTLNGTPANGTIYTFTKTNPVGLSHFDAQQKITLYPNPMVNELTLNYGSEMPRAEIHFVNAAGQTVYKQHHSGRTLTLSGMDLPSGIYFVQLRNNGEIIATEKLLVQ